MMEVGDAVVGDCWFNLHYLFLGCVDGLFLAFMAQLLRLWCIFPESL